jgi:uncharacterized membrane protein
MLNKLLRSKNSIFLLINTLLVFFQVFIILFFYPEIHNQIPLWYTKNWGLGILSEKAYIFLLPIISIIITIGSYLILRFSEKFYQYLFFEVISYFVTIANLIITYSLTNIIKKTTKK